MKHTPEQTCYQVRASAGEYALGLLPSDEQAWIARHLIGCPDCRREVDDMARLGEELSELIPDAEPPLGFDQRVLAAIGADSPPTRTRSAHKLRARWASVAVAAAAVVIAVVASLTLSNSSGSKGHHELRAALTSDGQVIGTVYTEGNPAWVWMNVGHAAISGPVSCDLVDANGRTVTLGTFDLVDGSGSWATPEPPGFTNLTAAQLVSAGGRIIATAAFKA